MKTLAKICAALLLGMMGATTAAAQQTAEDTASQSEKSKPQLPFKFRMGGYGEILANFKDYGTNRFYGGSDGNSKVNRATISIPRHVVAMDYNFNEHWQLGTEIEFEAGGTGQAVELENSENGEYETEVEKGGEVALEQFHITYSFSKEANVRVGHLILPVGLTNAHHEPIFFFGTSRPEGETTLLPSTWHESGLEVFGTLGSGFATFDYDLIVCAGLNANGFDRNTWVAGGKQGFFEQDNFTSPAYVARVDWKGVKGLRVGASYYYCHDAGKNADKFQTYSAMKPISVGIFTADAQYTGTFVTARANVVAGTLANSAELSTKNGKLSNKSPYSRLTPIANKALCYNAELGVNVARFFGGRSKKWSLVPFVHYEYYNPQQSGESGQVMDSRCQVSMWTVGVNWFALPNLVVKADYTTRHIGTQSLFGKGQYNSENEFGLAVAYTAWYWKK